MNSNSAAIITNSKECTRHIQYYATLENYLSANGYTIREDFEVDRVFICACGFHDFMFGKVARALKYLDSIQFPKEAIYVMGCLPKTHTGDLEQAFKGPIIPFGQEQKLDALLQAEIPYSQVQLPNVFRIQHDEPQTDLFYIKIAQGCFRKCTFCVINKVKGKLRSEPAAEIQTTFKRGVEEGYRHFFLMAEDTFAYGMDCGTSIVNLTQSLIDIEPRAKFSFGSLHIKWLGRYAEDILKLCQSGHVEHLHIGLQHVDDEILRRMGRPICFAEIYDKIGRIKAACPEVILSADMMVGFPGETEEKFDKLIDFFRNDTHFDQISHFGYSDVKGAPSARLDGKVDALQVSYRWEKLRQVLGQKSYYNQSVRTVDDRNRRYREAYVTTFEQDFTFCVNSNSTQTEDKAPVT